MTEQLAQAARELEALLDSGRVLLNEPLKEINLTKVNDTLTLTDQDKAMILEAVNNAIKTPFAVTNSTYTEAK